MPFAVGDRARVRLTSTALSLGSASKVQPQPPLIGVVTRVVGGAPDLINVTFADGKTLTSVAATALEKITDATADVVTAFLDKVAVGISNARQMSQELRGPVIDLYGVDPGAAGAPSQFLLIKPTDGPWYEVSATSAVAIADR